MKVLNYEIPSRVLSVEPVVCEALELEKKKKKSIECIANINSISRNYVAVYTF
jgi:hypothetical protein